jgi:hypothetical protein
MGLTVLSPFQGLGCFGHIKPRAALRFALGYHLAPRWGKKPSGIMRYPRAALRFALGYHLAPRWGKKPSGIMRYPRAALRFALGYPFAPRWGKKPSIATWVPGATRGSAGAGDGGEGREG